MTDRAFFVTDQVRGLGWLVEVLLHAPDGLRYCELEHAKPLSDGGQAIGWHGARGRRFIEIQPPGDGPSEWLAVSGPHTPQAPMVYYTMGSWGFSSYGTTAGFAG